MTHDPNSSGGTPPTTNTVSAVNAPNASNPRGGWPWEFIVTFFTASMALLIFLWPSGLGNAAIALITLAVAAFAVVDAKRVHVASLQPGLRRWTVVSLVAVVAILATYFTLMPSLIGVGSANDFVARIPAFMASYTIVFVTFLQAFSTKWKTSRPAFIFRIAQLVLAGAGAFWVFVMSVIIAKAN
jgi:hypothetical protein